VTFAPGESVRVKDAWPEAFGPVHIRTPHYVRGVTGEVVRHLGDFANPEDLAFRRPAPVLPLYHVRFRKDAIWPEAKPDDELLIEIFEHWLERP
jgi:nitrile hydratase